MIHDRQGFLEKRRLFTGNIKDTPGSSGTSVSDRVSFASGGEKFEKRSVSHREKRTNEGGGGKRKGNELGEPFGLRPTLFSPD